MMYLARILYPVEVLGPGKRVGIWLSGCYHGCEGCSNPELWQQKSNQLFTLKDIYMMINQINEHHKIDGFTITGGEPFEQIEGLHELILYIKNIRDDILVYSGYTLDELKDKNNPKVKEICENISVLIDGRYVESLNQGLQLRGSANQRIIILNKKYEKAYKKILQSKAHTIQNFHMQESVISVGIHHPSFNEKMDGQLKKRGIKHE